MVIEDGVERDRRPVVWRRGRERWVCSRRVSENTAGETHIGVAFYEYLDGGEGEQ